MTRYRITAGSFHSAVSDMPYLIDGFNLLYKFPEFEKLMYESRLSDARTGLLSKLRVFSRLSRAKIRIVFDGKKEPSFEVKSERVGSIDVYYSLDYSADFLIKQFIKKDLNPRMTTVVTSDKDIIDFVMRFRAKTQKSEDFADYVNRVIDELNREKLPEKEDNPVLTDDDITFWEKLFGVKKK